MPRHLITFFNNTSFPINIATWNNLDFTFSEYITTLVPANTTAEIRSETGEYFLDTYLFNKEMCDEWKAAGYKLGNEMGKFRDHPSYSGDYAWNVHDDFEIVYDPEKRTGTFSKRDLKTNT
jgi:hypothetical protein